MDEIASTLFIKFTDLPTVERAVAEMVKEGTVFKYGPYYSTRKIDVL